MKKEELKEFCKEYIIKILELEETRLKAINLGFNPSDTIKAELELIKISIDILKEEL